MGNLETVEALYEIQDAISRLPHRPSPVVRSGLQSVKIVVPHRQVQFVAVEVHTPEGRRDLQRASVEVAWSQRRANASSFRNRVAAISTVAGRYREGASTGEHRPVVLHHRENKRRADAEQ